jgi:hypothetical protein
LADATGGRKRVSAVAEAAAASRREREESLREFEDMAGVSSWVFNAPRSFVANLTTRMAQVKQSDPREWKRLKMLRQVVKEQRVRTKQRARDARSAPSGAHSRPGDGSHLIRAPHAAGNSALIDPTSRRVTVVDLSADVGGSFHADADDTTMAEPLRQSRLSFSIAPPAVAPPPPPRVRTKPLLLYLLRVHLPRVPALPEFVPHAFSFWLRQPPERESLDEEALAADLRRDDIVACETLQSETTLQQLITIVQERIWTNCGVRVDLDGFGANEDSPLLPVAAPVADVFAGEGRPSTVVLVLLACVASAHISWLNLSCQISRTCRHMIASLINSRSRFVHRCTASRFIIHRISPARHRRTRKR